MGPICCPETSVTKYRTTLCKTTEKHRSDSHRGGKLKSPKLHFIYNTSAAQTARTRLFNSKHRTSRSISSRKNIANPLFAHPVSRKTPKLRVHRRTRFTLLIVSAKQLPATTGLPQCAKLSVCKHSWTYAASDSRNFKESLKN